MTLRRRIVLTLVPLFVLLAVLGGGGLGLLSWLGGRIDLILRENYQSILAMRDLDDALDEMNQSFLLTLAGRPEGADSKFDKVMEGFWSAVRREEQNITLDGEGELAAQLRELGQRFEAQGRTFFSPPGQPDRERLYFGTDDLPGLRSLYSDIKETSRQIVRINQDNMERANRDAADAASKSLVGFGVGLAAVAALAVLVVWQTVRTILRPIQAVTQSALAIGGGNLDQVVPVVSHDELGRLAEAFNLMARQLRHYRQTHYQQLLRAQRTSQATIDSFPHPVLVLDQEGRVTMSNPAARRLLGVAPKPVGPEAETTSQPAWQPPEPLRSPLADALRQQRPYVPEGFDHALSWRIADQEHFFLPRLLPIQDPFGNTLGAAVLLEDVTRLRLVDQVKSNLAATVSHEMKTPLAGLRLALHVLLEESVGPLSPKQTELLIDARDNAERLLALVNDLLDLARLEDRPGEMEFRREKPAELLRSAADLNQHRAQEKQLKLTVQATDDLPSIAVEPERFGSALQNLVQNAVTYTNPGGSIWLRARTDDGFVVLEVEDTGCGIPVVYLPHIFERFFRVPGQSQPPGTGLGLAIVREVVAAHGGTIMVESEVGKGTTFRLRLPAAKEVGDGR